MTLIFDLWPWPFAWTSLVSMVITPGNFMMILWQEHCEEGVMYRETDRWIDEQDRSWSCLVAAKKPRFCNHICYKWAVCCTGHVFRKSAYLSSTPVQTSSTCNLCYNEDLRVAKSANVQRRGYVVQVETIVLQSRFMWALRTPSGHFISSLEYKCIWAANGALVPKWDLLTVSCAYVVMVLIKTGPCDDIWVAKRVCVVHRGFVCCKTLQRSLIVARCHVEKRDYVLQKCITLAYCHALLRGCVKASRPDTYEVVQHRHTFWKK